MPPSSEGVLGVGAVDNRDLWPDQHIARSTHAADTPLNWFNWFVLWVGANIWVTESEGADEKGQHQLEQPVSRSHAMVNRTGQCGASPADMMSVTVQDWMRPFFSLMWFCVRCNPVATAKQ